MPTKIITRAEWKAREPLARYDLSVPVKEVLFLSCGVTNNMSEVEVVKWLPQLQEYCMDRLHEYDVPYNWLIDFNGNIYEGRGWTTTVEKFNPAYYVFNKKTIDIGFIGTFNEENHAPKAMEKTATILLDLGMRQKFIVKNRELKIYNWNSFNV